MTENEQHDWTSVWIDYRNNMKREMRVRSHKYRAQLLITFNQK